MPLTSICDPFHHSVPLITLSPHKPVGRWLVICVIEDWLCSIESQSFDAGNVETMTVPSNTDGHGEVTLIAVKHGQFLFVIITNKYHGPLH